jgi:L-fucose isomerase-like protein
MDKLRAKLLAFSAADLQIFHKGKKRLQKVFHQQKVEYVDQDPDVLVFLTGGSERGALQSVKERGFYLLLATSSDNSWAAATEVKAWMNQNKISSMLVDFTSAQAIVLVDTFYKVKNGLKRLKGQRFGLVGEPSEWLVNSNIDPFLVKARLGIEQINIPWKSISVKGINNIAPEFISFFKGFDQSELTSTGKVYEALTKVIIHNDLSAVTVECFSLVANENTTACLALSKLSMDGIPAGCEGDICSILGMMLTKELFGIIPWIANTNHVDANKVMFSHCTVPANLLKDFKLETHFETGKGVAISGTFDTPEFTILRLDHTLTKVFIAKGKVIQTPHRKDFCRTQVLLEVSSDTSYYFTNNPLGNHHILIPGNYVLGLELAAKLLGMEVIN